MPRETRGLQADRDFRIAELVRASLLTLSTLLATVPSAAGELPDGVQPLSSEREAQLQELVAAAERFRSLEAGERIPVGQQGVEEVERYLESALDDALPEERVPGVERLLKWFGVIPADLSVPDFLVELLTAQVAGYYDPESGHLVVVDGPNSVAEAFADQPELAERMDNSILLHEIVHYLQDEHFDLEKLLDGDLLGDDVAARQALAEGDATLAMYSYMMGVELERIGYVRSMFEALLRDPTSLIEAAPNLPGASELLEAPAYFRETLIFPYLRGMLFNLALRQRGGTKLVDYAYREDPPQSTEQILHPEKWLDQYDGPVVLAVPDVGGLVAGGAAPREIDRGAWGELGLRVLLSERSPETPAEVAEAAAAGWGGDLYVLYELEGADYLAWVTEWDRAEDADEFMALAREAFSEWRLDRSSPTRVVLVDSAMRGGTERASAVAATDAIEKALAGRFAAATAERMESTRGSLESIGISASDMPEPLGILELLNLSEDPAIGQLFAQGAEMGQGDALVGMMSDPEVQEQVAAMFSELGPDELAEVMAHPAMQEMIAAQQEQMLAGRPEVVLTESALEIPALGARLALPETEGWNVADDPATGTIQIVHPDGAGLIVAILPLDPASPFDAIVLGLESQFVSQGYERIAEDRTSIADNSAYTAHFSHAAGGLEMDVRLVLVGEHGILISATAGTMTQAGFVAELAASFESLSLSGP